MLGDDSAFRDHIAGLRDKLLKPKIGRWGQLQEWEQDKDDPKDDHRHVSHLFALHPGRQITKAGTPALPKAWPDGRISGVRARGGFELDITWKNSRLTKAVIHSRSGLPCKVVYGGKPWDLETKPGNSYPLTPA